jgi:hypothetical protein
MIHQVQAKKSFGLDYTQQDLSEKIASTTRKGIFRDGYFILEDVKVFDADDNVIERYDRLEVMADVERDSGGERGGSVIQHVPYIAALHCEEKGLFLPSIALSCVILSKLFILRDDSRFHRVLGQYKEIHVGSGWGYHCQNSMIDWKRGKVIHYPSPEEYGKKGNINSGKRVSLDFDKSNLRGIDLESALENESHRKFVRQLTGLQDPSILVEIGEHFEKIVYLWIPEEKASTVTVWLGTSDSLDLNINGSFNNYNAYRGVRIG